MPDLQTVTLTKHGAAARIELNRPEKLNAWNAQFGLDLRAAVDDVAADDAIRAVMITGAGRGFSSGADLTDLPSDFTPEGRPHLEKILTERYHPIIEGVRHMPKPVVAGVNGPAVGIGCSLALACDFVVAADSAYFLLAFVNIGLVPDGGSSLFIPARVGFTRAARMALLGERIPAPQALEWGLINEAHPAEEAMDVAWEYTERFASGPTKSYAGTKRQLNAWMYGRMEEQLALEARIQQEMADSGDFAEGVKAFAEKRSPDFQGA
jgi:2-(1,2-epoxy-1,2-dihydrophenyl)acetyl-CoA isomerase